MANNNFYFCRNYEDLIRKFAEILRENKTDNPFLKNYAVVQTPGMRQWLAMETAKQEGIFGHFKFFGIGEFLDILRKTIEPSKPHDVSLFNQHIMKWFLYNILIDNDPSQLPDALKDYLEKRQDPLSRFQLAEKTADFFDQYMIYRPEIIGKWNIDQSYYDAEENPELSALEKWQKTLWLNLKKILGEEKDRTQLRDELITQFQDKNIRQNFQEEFGGSLCLFGFSTLPPFYLNLLAGLPLDVHFFLMKPFPDEGSGLLPSAFTKTAVDLFNQLKTQFSNDYNKAEMTEHQYPDNLLGQIQKILVSESASPENSIAPDNTLIITVNYSKLREVEVLKDYLLNLFNTEPSLNPSDILVMAPDIDNFASYIQGVFTTDIKDKNGQSIHIPYRISNLVEENENTASGIILKLFEILDSRMTAQEIYGIISSQPIREHFDFDDHKLEKIKMWIRETGIRWGYDAESRRKKGSTENNSFSWKQGFESLLTGFAVSQKEQKKFRGTVPFEKIEGEDRETLAALINIVTHIQKFGNSGLQTYQQWIDKLNNLKKVFFGESSDNEEEIRLNDLETALDQMRLVYTNSRLDENQREKIRGRKIPLKIFTHEVQTFLEQQTAVNRRFLYGGVNFSSFVPMRTIPFKVIAMIGLNENDYPRRFNPDPLDLISLAPKEGDRNTRNNDYDLFLENLLSAKEKLYLSYTGFSERDLAVMNPSKPLEELINFLAGQLDQSTSNDQSFETEEFKNATEEYKILNQCGILKIYPLHPYSRKYFKQKPLINTFTENPYSDSGTQNQETTCPHCIETLPDKNEEGDIYQQNFRGLLYFLKDPCKFFYQKRFHSFLLINETLLEESDPMIADNLDKYQIQNTLFSSKLYQRINNEWIEALLKQSGSLPYEHFGKDFFQRQEIRIDEIYQEYFHHAETVSLDLNYSYTHLFSCLDNQPEKTFTIKSRDKFLTGICNKDRPESDQSVLLFTSSKLHGKSVLEPLLLSAILGLNESQIKSVILISSATGEAEKFSMTTAQAEKVLQNIMKLYAENLISPQPFFPKTGLIYSKNKINPKKNEENEARKKYNTGFTMGENEESEYFSYFYPDFASFWDNKYLKKQFTEASTGIFDPDVCLKIFEKI